VKALLIKKEPREYRKKLVKRRGVRVRKRSQKKKRFVRKWKPKKNLAKTEATQKKSNCIRRKQALREGKGIVTWKRGYVLGGRQNK